MDDFENKDLEYEPLDIDDLETGGAEDGGNDNAQPDDWDNDEYHPYGLWAKIKQKLTPTLILVILLNVIIIGLIIALLVSTLGGKGKKNKAASTAAAESSVSQAAEDTDPGEDRSDTDTSEETDASSVGSEGDNDSQSADEDSSSQSDTEDNDSQSQGDGTSSGDPQSGGSSGNSGGSSGGNSSSGNSGGSSEGNNGGGSSGGNSGGNSGGTSGGNSGGSDADVSGDIVVTYSGNNTWDNSGVTMTGVEIGIKNNKSSAISGWELVLEIEGLSSCDGWNGTYKISGNKLTVTAADYNSEIQPGGNITIGANMGTKGAFSIKSGTLNGEPVTLVKGTVAQENNQQQQNNDQNNQGNNNNDQNNNNQNTQLSSADVEKLLERTSSAKQGDDWLFTDGKKIVDKNGKEVWITGVNWFGYNTGTNIFDGLWNSEFEPTIKAIADHGFNLIRVPMSAELINQWASGEYPQANYNNAYNPTLNSMNSQQIFDYFLKLAEENGMKVMPDIHCAKTDAAGHNVNLWYNGDITVDDYYAALEYMAERYKDNDTIIAYDLKNEPHGKPYEGKNAAIWNNSKDANNWKYVAETAAKKILAKNPNVLIMVEGIEIYPKNIKTNGSFSSTNDDDYYFNWWGGNLRGVADYPIDLGKYQNKLVYSPHDYGPTVYQQPWFTGNYTFDSLMKDCWQDNWFYIYKKNIAPLLIGEWGGFMTEPNLTWMTYMRKLIKDNHLHHTFWCFNANSGDTGGLVLDDFKTWDEEKYKFVKEVLWQENGKFVGLDHAIPLGANGITLSKAKGL